MTAKLAEPGEMSVSADSHMGHHCSCLIYRMVAIS